METYRKKRLIPNIDFSKIEQQNSKLRPYQVEMKQRVFDTWQAGKKSIMMQMPTGTGKTMLFVSIIKDIWDSHFDRKTLKKFLILVHRKELIEQVQRTLYLKGGLAHGTIGGGNKEDDLFHIQVAMVHTLAKEKRLNHWLENEFDFIICDEAHHFLANDYLKIRKAFPDAYLLGVTATPYRLNHQPFTDYFDILLRTKSVNEFIKEGWLSEYEYYSIDATSSVQTEINNLRVLNTGDYSEYAMSNALDKKTIRAGVVKTWLKYAKGKKTIVYTINKQHNKNLCEEFEKEGFNCVAIDSDTPKEKREEFVEKFRNGAIDIICNVNIFSEGFDCPDVECIQLARPTTSLSMYLQQVGRGLRISKNKDKTIFLDNVGLYNRFGLPSANRQWQRHFIGDENWDDKNDYNLEEDDIHRARIIDIEEADDDFYQVYSNVQDKDMKTIGKVMDFLGISFSEILSYLNLEEQNTNLNTVLSEEQYNSLLSILIEKSKREAMKGDDGFISIFDLKTDEVVGRKHFFYRVKNFRTLKYHTIKCDNFVDCYVDVVNKVYCDYLCSNLHKYKDIYKVCEKLEIIDGPAEYPHTTKIVRTKILSNGNKIETNLSNVQKIERLKYLLSYSKENMFFRFYENFITEQDDKIIEIPENIENTQEITNYQKNIIKIDDMEYNVDSMNEKEIIELICMLHDKVSIEFIDKQKVEDRLQEIEKEDELLQLDKRIEQSEHDEEEILRMAERIQQKRKEKQESV
ncbi:MAG: DEAD/DEAH box helicase family protein [Bacteroidales bacterium]|nr:DEAD/DEAH box helicase family protein [Bacteroidales bacterium]